MRFLRTPLHGKWLHEVLHGYVSRVLAAQVFTGIVDGTSAIPTTFSALDTLTGEKTDATLNTLKLVDAGADAGNGLTTALITPLAATLNNIGNLQIVAQDNIGTLSTTGTL